MRALVLSACGALAMLLSPRTQAQVTIAFADSLRMQYAIPELAYAVVSSSDVLAIQVIGEKRAGSTLPAAVDDRFRIGSNTKTITAFLAARLVHDRKIAWSTRFFDLFPELRENSRKAYRGITLLDLLSFRTRLCKYTYTDAEPKQDAFPGDEAQQRYRFAAWALAHAPAPKRDSISFSNPGYALAGLMLEKASGRSYVELVNELGTQLDIHFGFGAPNRTDSLQPWGHDAQLRPEPPADSYKLEWLQAAGNINVSLPDHVKFIRLLLQGAQGRSDLLTKAEFEFLLFGRPRFAVGWYWNTDDAGDRIAYHIGNPGTFLSKVYVDLGRDRAFILFANAQTDNADAGLDALYEVLRAGYVK